MKIKTFILTFLMMMSSPFLFGQHWTDPGDTGYNQSMSLLAQIFLDDGVQEGNYEVAAFYNDELLGVGQIVPLTGTTSNYHVHLNVQGNTTLNGIYFKFFNGTNEYVSSTEMSFTEGLKGSHSNYEPINFYSVAQIGDVVYPSLQKAINACKEGDNTIELLADNAEDVTIKQVEGVNVTIDGGTSRYDYSGTITIHGNARHDGAETLTFQNINFTTNEAGHYFIDSNSTESDERYAHNVTVSNCNFTAEDAGVNSAVAMRIRQGFDIAINGGTFTGLHSVLQAYGNAGINITGITSNCKNGISVGSSTNVVITGSDITATGATGYGVRAGENVTGPITITGTEINAFIPVSVRKVTDDTNCEFTFTGNTMTASNTDGYWCVIGTSEYEANGSLPETAGKIIVNATEQDLAGVYGYSRVEVTFADSTTKYFYMMEDAVPYNDADNYEGATIKLLSNCAGRGLRFWENDMTFDLNGKNYTITQAVGSSGTESQGFQIRPEVTGNVTIKNGTIDIKAGTNVKWMFNSYAADFVVQNVTIDGTNMVTNTSEDYLLVVQNAGDKATFDNVTINNYTAKKVYLEGNTTFVAPQEFDNIEIPADYVLVYENGAYIVKAGNVLNVNTGEKYDKISSAITAATAGDKLQLLQDITEDVTITKNITLDGAGKNYTGKITLNKVNFTAENVNFVKGNIYKNKNTGVGGTYTIKNCTFDGQSMNDYAVNLGGTSAIVIEGVTAKDYGYGFLQVPASNTSVSVKDVEISNVNYGLKIDYSGGVTLENVKAVASVAGVLNSNYGAKTITIKNSELSILGTWTRNNTTKTTYVFEGANSIDEFVIDAAIDNFKLADVNSTLTAPNNITVTTDVENSIVVYENGMYKVKPAVASITAADATTTYYETLAGAVEAATAGQTVNLLKAATGAGLKINKNVTIDFGGFTYTINQAVGSTGTESQGFQLLKNNTVTLKNGNIAIAEGTTVKWMFNAYADVTLENLNVNCANMAAPAENEANYVLVVNNGGSATPTVTYTNVIVTNFPSTATAQIWLDPTTTLKAGAGLENSIETEEDYVVVYNNGEYTAIAGNVLNVNTGVKYATLADAIAAAQAGNTIKLLADITEDVTVNKDLTINGDNKHYTGNISVGETSTDITVKNVNFVDGTGYAITTNRIKSVTVENCTVTNYGYGFLYANKSTPTVVVKNVTVEGGNYGFHWVYGTTATLENVTMTDVTYGLYIQNYAGKTINVKNSTISSIGIWERSGYSGVQTFNFKGVNTVGTLTSSQYAKYVLAEADATLAAPEGSNVTTSVENHEVDYENGVYFVSPALSGSGTEEDPFMITNLDELIIFRDHVNAGKTKYNADGVYVALGANIDMDAVDWSVNIGDDCNYTFDGIFDGRRFTISNLNSTETAQKADGYVCTGLFGAIYGNAVIKNLTIENVNINTGEFTGNNVAAVVGFVYGVSGKTVTIDGVKVTGDINIDASGVYGVGAIVGYSYNQGTLNIKNCAVEANDESAITAVSGSGAIIGYCGGKATIEACSVQNIDITAKGLVGGIAGITENSVNKVLSGNTVKDVTLTATKAEWVNSTAIAVGTMDGNGLTVANTIFENVNASRMVGSVYAEQPTYVVPAVEARIENKYYGTFDAALAAAQEGNTITVLAPVVITEDMTYNLTGLSVVGENVYPIFRIQNGANVVVANGNISNDDYVFVLGASDGSSAGNLTIESGVYTGTTTVASVTKGLLKINGGEFKVNDSEYGATYMINCIDANYNDDSANVEIYGGKFYGFNPEDNDAEGANTNFCAPGYAANEIETGVYEVVAGNVLNQTTGNKYATLSAAVSAAQQGNTIELLKDITEDVTVDKSLTIDGKNNTYTGKMEMTNKADITVKNVNFDGKGYNGYAIESRGAYYITVEDCTAKNYGYGFIQLASGNVLTTIKDVTVSNMNYGVKVDYSNEVVLENVDINCAVAAVLNSNYGTKTITIKDSYLSILGTWTRNNTIKTTYVFEGENSIDDFVIDAAIDNFKLADVNSTLAAPNEITVTTDMEGYEVEYKDGKYIVVANKVELVRDGESQGKFATIQAAIDAAENGDEIVVLKDITLGTGESREYTTTSGGTVSVRALNLISGKSVTIDLNGNTLYCEEEAEENQIYNFFAVTEEGHLTIKDSSEDGTGTVEIKNNDADATTVHSLIMCYNGTMTIENGNYKLHYGKNGNGMIYSQQNETVTVNGGNFWLGNVGTLENHSPWIFNASGRNGNRIIVNGGTFNDDVLHQYYAFEVESSVKNALVNNNNGTWSVITNGAVAHVTERYVYPANYTTNYTNTVGYATLKDAFAAAHTYNYVTEEEMSTVTMLKDVTLDAYVTISKSVNLNLDQFNITREDGTALYFNGEGIEVTINGEGTVSGTQAVYVDNGTVTINGGNYVGGYEAVYVINNGHAVINGGTFGAENDEDDTDFVLNEYDATRDVTTIAVYGGTFHGFNPENNAAEGAGTNFCAQGYGAVETSTGSNIWEVMPVQKQSLVAGWNWYSSYLKIKSEDLLLALGTNGSAVVSDNGGGDAYYDESYGWDNSLTENLDLSKMYMIETSIACDLNLAGELADASTITITLNPGWNWIGYPSNVETRISDAFSGFTPDNGDVIKTKANSFAEYYEGQWYDGGVDMTMEPTKGYMYYNASSSKTFTYNIVPVTTRGNNETAVATHYSVDYTKYPFNMTMVAVVDGAMNDNYEVAALVNGEVRGSARPVYIESMDAYMLFLSINGDAVEEMTFKYYDLTTGEEYDLVNRIDYSNNAMIGSVNEPYVLSRGTTGIGDATMSQVNIYPNPTTTGTEINLQTVCDTVEVFNALGVKVAEYQNVDSIDALETAGIYVIRITNDGNVQNCRLVVK